MPSNENPRCPPAPPLLLVGGSVRAAAASAVRAGFSVWSCDVFGDADLAELGPVRRTTDFPSGYPRALVTAVATAPVAPLVYTGALENHPEILEQLSRLRPLLGNAPDVVRAVRNPLVLASRLRAAGLATPDVTLTPPAAAPESAAMYSSHTAARRWLRKPWNSAGGERIRHFGPSTTDSQHDRAADSTSTDDTESRWFYQEFIPGTPVGAVYIAAGGTAQLLGVTRQLIGRRWPQSSGFYYAGSLGPLPLSAAQLATFARIGDCLARDFSLTGIFGVDAIMSSDAIWPIEVNPRWTASVEVLERARSTSFMNWHVDACEQGRLPTFERDSLSALLESRPQQFGKLIVYADRPLVVERATTERWLDQHRRDTWPTIADIPIAGQTIPRHAPICTVFAAGPSAAAVERQLIAARDAVVAWLSQ